MVGDFGESSVVVIEACHVSTFDFPKLIIPFLEMRPSMYNAMLIQFYMQGLLNLASFNG